MPLLIEYGDYFGTLVFAITGGLAAAEKKLDFGGFFLLAFLTGVGGGTVRDVILDRGPVFWADQPIYVVLCLTGAAIAFIAGERVGRRRRLLVWSDAVGLAIFSVIGAAIALELNFRPITAVLMGTLTATGGGLIRDVVRVLTESTPRDTDVDAIRSHLLETPGVVAVHDVHVWAITSSAPVFTAHVECDPEVFEQGDAGELLDRLGDCLRGHFDVAHSTFQLEPAGHVDRGDSAHR